PGYSPSKAVEQHIGVATDLPGRSPPAVLGSPDHRLGYCRLTLTPVGGPQQTTAQEQMHAGCSLLLTEMRPRHSGLLQDAPWNRFVIVVVQPVRSHFWRSRNRRDLGMASRPDHRNRNVNEVFPQPEFLKAGATQIAPDDCRIGRLGQAP